MDLSRNGSAPASAGVCAKAAAGSAEATARAINKGADQPARDPLAIFQPVIIIFHLHRRRIYFLTGHCAEFQGDERRNVERGDRRHSTSHPRFARYALASSTSRSRPKLGSWPP